MSRLNPKESTLKRLFALSGNQCAIPGCTRPLVNDSGDLIAEVCHIKAANKGGSRYDPDQSDEERRAFKNLLVLCPTHHLETDNEQEFPVERLLEIKEQHERETARRSFDFEKSLTSRAVIQALEQLRNPTNPNVLMSACQAQVTAVIEDVRSKYDSKLYVHRGIECDINSFIDDAAAGSRNCFLVVAPAGSGKTNLFCQLAAERMDRQPVLLLLGGNIYLGKTTGLLATIQQELEGSSEVAFPSAASSLQVLRRSASGLNRDALIILDAINEYERPGDMRKAISHLLRQTRGSRVKIIVSCRDFYWKLFKGGFWETSTINFVPCDEETEDESSRHFSYYAPIEHKKALRLYWNQYSITGRLVGKALKHCRHPLLLRFFCEAYRGQAVGEIHDIRLKELFDVYWAQKLSSIAERRLTQGEERTKEGLERDIEEYLLALAGYMLNQNVRAIPISDMSRATRITDEPSDPRSLYGRIRDEFIILEERQVMRRRTAVIYVAFVYEEFMEYTIARALISQWEASEHDDRQIILNIEDLTERHGSFAQIFGVVIYIALMLKEKRELRVWSLLMDQGERWQKLVFEAIRRLPSDQLESEVFAVLRQALTSNRNAVVMSALNVIKLARIARSAPTHLIRTVIELSERDDSRIPRRAVLALANMSSKLVFPALVKATKHPKQPVRVNAAKAISMHAGPEAVSALITVLEDENWIVRRKAADALDQIEWTPSDDRERGWYHAAKCEWLAFANLGISVIQPLVYAAGDKRQEIAEGATAAFENFGPQAVEPLITFLKSRGGLDFNRFWRARDRIAEALGRIGPQIADRLILALDDDSDYVREAAAKALGAIKDDRAVEALIGVLAAKKSYFRADQIIKALGETGDPRAVQPLKELLDKEPSGYQHIVVESLLRISHPQVIDPLANSLHKLDFYLQGKVVHVLAELGATDVLISSFQGADYSLREKLVTALETCGESAIAGLMSACSAKNAQVRSGVIRVIGGIGGHLARTALREAMADENTDVRRTACAALATAADAEDERLLVAALSDEDASVRAAACKALARKADAKKASLLVAALSDEDHQVRKEAACALGDIRDSRSIQALETALKDPNADVAGAAAGALGQFEMEAAQSLSIAINADRWQVAESTAEALTAIGSPARPLLLATIVNGTANGRQFSAKALGTVGGAEAVTPLIAALEDMEHEVRRQAAKSLGKLKDSRSLPALISVLKDKDRFVRWAAIEALGEIKDDRVIEPLTEMLRDPEHCVIEAASDVLENMGWKPNNEEQRAWYLRAKGRWETLANLGPSLAIPPLTAALKGHGYELENVATILDDLGWKPSTDEEKAWYLQAKGS